MRIITYQLSPALVGRRPEEKARPRLATSIAVLVSGGGFLLSIRLI